ncbi:MAG: sigma factor-like helix-turn-helix DNA-binding protein [Dehalococcoidia bacterium]|jgi:ssDNA-binding Zn-finger/Zn-ribbon topoisomerase 1
MDELTANMLNSLSISEYAFTADFKVLDDYIDSEVNYAELEDAIQSDDRFLLLQHVISSDQDYYITKQALFSWFVGFTLRLTNADKVTLSGRQLASYMSSLLPYDRWTEPPIEAILFGRSYGFIGPALEPNSYVFPTAHILSFLTNHKSRRIRHILYDLFKVGEADFYELLARAFVSAFLDADPRQKLIIEKREGLNGEVKSTLQQIADELSITRERVRQIETKSWKRLRHSTRYYYFVVPLISFVRLNRGSLIVKSASPEAAPIRFLAKYLGIPTAQIPTSDLIVLGISEQDLSNLDMKHWDVKETEIGKTASFLVTQGHIYLIDSDLKAVSEVIHVLACAACNKLPTNNDRLVAALRYIGKPAHYTKIAEVHNSLFSENTISEGSIYNALCAERLGIVWVGIRGVYALKEWGYERPSKGLHETVAEIVGKKYAETSTPVSFEVICAEMGNHRKIFNPNSVLFAASFNPRVERVHTNYFIPATTHPGKEDITSDDLDRILSEFQTQNCTAGSEESEGKSSDSIHESVHKEQEKVISTLKEDLKESNDVKGGDSLSVRDVLCPECNSKTTVRTAKKGTNIGKKFHVCCQYPECKGKVPLEAEPDNKTISVSHTETVDKDDNDLQLISKATSSDSDITKYGADFFFSLSHWMKVENKLQPWQRGIIFSIGKYLHQGWPISEKQALQAKRIIKQMMQAGFTEELAKQMTAQRNRQH